MEKLDAVQLREGRIGRLAWALWSVTAMTLLVSLLLGRQDALAVHPLAVLALPLWSVSQRIWAPRQPASRRAGGQAEAWIPLAWAVLLLGAALWGFLK